MINCNFERCEAAAKILTLMIVLISDETWNEQITTETQSHGLRKAMIGFVINGSIIEKVDYTLAFLRDKTDFDHFIVNALSLLTEFLDVIQSNKEQLLTGPSEENFIQSSIMASLRKTDFVGVFPLLDETLQRNGPIQRKGVNSPRPGKDFTKIASQGLDLLNNIATLDFDALQEILSSEEVGIQLVHVLANTLISTSSVYWRKEHEVEYTTALLAQLLQLVINFTRRHRINQDRMRFDVSPLLVQLARLPFHFFLHSVFKDQLFPAIINACYDNEPNVTLISAELSVAWIVTYLEGLKDERAREPGREIEREEDKEKPAAPKEKDRERPYSTKT